LSDLLECFHRTEREQQHLQWRINIRKLREVVEDHGHVLIRSFLPPNSRDPLAFTCKHDTRAPNSSLAQPRNPFNGCSWICRPTSVEEVLALIIFSSGLIVL
jgi:hypothetical protein